MPDVAMPRLSDSMEEGTILTWLKADGDEVAEGDELAEIETDKATQTYEAQVAGVLRIVAAEGTTVPVGATIARLEEVGAEARGNGASARGAPAGGAETAAPAATTPATTTSAATAPAAAATAPAAAGAQAAGGEAPATPAAPSAPARDEVRASPVARRIARKHGIDLATVRGSGPGGRVVRADVAPPEEREGAPPAAPAPPAPPAPPAAPAPASGGTAKGDVTEQELTRTQQVIARRMAESKATIPDFSITTEVDMERAVDLRAQLKALGGDVVPSYNDMVVRACGLALREHPKANGSYRDGRFVLHGRVNVGVAVAADGALVVPTVFDADRKPLAQIAEETRALAGRVRAGAVTAAELSGGTFTVSNMGMHGVTEFQAVINPPQAAILAVGQLRQLPVVRDGAIVARHVLKVTLVCDHRILYGAEAAAFLARVRELLEAPAALLA